MTWRSHCLILIEKCQYTKNDETESALFWVYERISENMVEIYLL